MKVKSPLTFRNKAGEVVFAGDAVDSSELKDFQLITKPEPYETKVVRDVPADEPRETVAPATKRAVKKTTTKKAD